MNYKSILMALLPTCSEERGVLEVGSIPVALLPTGSEEREVLGAGSIPVAILPSCHNMKPYHYNCININIDG